MNLPTKYSYLSKEPAPKMLLEALKLYGIVETSGAANTPAIMNWAVELGGNVRAVYGNDSVPWCGLFIGIVAKRSGKPVPASPLWARSWSQWGENALEAMLGDVLVFVRKGGGHVGLYVGEDATAYHVLGGNQGDAVSIVRIDKSRCIARRRLYQIVPKNIRKIYVNSQAGLSANEA